jgi:hypothetical protein
MEKKTGKIKSSEPVATPIIFIIIFQHLGLNTVFEAFFQINK